MVLSLFIFVDIVVDVAVGGDGVVAVGGVLGVVCVFCVVGVLGIDIINVVVVSCVTVVSDVDNVCTVMVVVVFIVDGLVYMTSRHLGIACRGIGHQPGLLLQLGWPSWRTLCSSG